MDAVRVRPFHEEMTSILLEEIGKRQAQKRSSESVLQSSYAGENSLNLATSTAATVASESRSTGSASDKVIDALGVRRGMTAPAADSAVLKPLAGTADGKHGRSELVPSSGQDGVEVYQFPPLVLRTARARATTSAVCQAEERRKMALAMIEQHRGKAIADVEGENREGADWTAKSEMQPGVVATITPSAETSSLVSARLKSMYLCPAFSGQSVRWGLALGYYRREEAETLHEISKNPSRVAAYNRIVEARQVNTIKASLHSSEQVRAYAVNQISMV